MIKGTGSPLNEVRFKIIATTMPTTMPRIYSEIIASAGACGKNAAQSRPYTGSLAEHDMKGVSMTVIFRSCSEGSVRVDMMAGTLQPKPTSIGTKLRPESPKRRKILSMTKATRAMYPESSRMDSRRNSTTMMGKKEITLPTPVSTPSTTSDRTAWFVPKASRPAAAAAITASTACSSTPWRAAPTTPNVIQNTSPMMRMNIGMAVHLPVSTRSMATERLCSRLSCGLTTHEAQTCSMNEKRMSARAAMRSLPDSSSIWRMMCLMPLYSFSSRPSALRTSSSPSTSFVAAKRTGIDAAAAWSSIRCAMPWMQRCSAPWSGASGSSEQKSTRPGLSP